MIEGDVGTARPFGQRVVTPIIEQWVSEINSAQLVAIRIIISIGHQ